MRTLDKVKYTKGNKDLQSVNSEQDIELKVTNGEMQFSTDGTNFNKIVSYEVASINLDTAEDGLYLLKATSPTITYGNAATTAEELNGAIVQRVFEAGFGTTAQVIKTNGEIQRYFKSYISGATWSVKTYITTPVTTITNNSTDYEVPSAKCVYDNFTQKGVPSGGTQGQVLAKASGTDFDTEWVTPSGGKLYRHLIHITRGNLQFILVVITKTSQSMTLDSLQTFLTSIGTNNNSLYPISYKALAGTNSIKHYIGICAGTTLPNVGYIEDTFDFTNSQISSANNVLTLSYLYTLTDTVTEL